jgi:hypothetical protein
MALILDTNFLVDLERMQVLLFVFTAPPRVPTVQFGFPLDP